MELRIENEVQQLPAIRFNYDQIVAELEPKLAHYKSLVYTEETLSLAKKDRALLNNLAKAINSKKIEVKNKQLEPYMLFESQVKTILGMIDEATGVIDQQVKSYDEQKKTEKKTEIETYFAEASASLNGILAFDRVFNPKWLNTTAKMNAIKSEIDEVVRRTQADIALIDGLHSEFETELKTTYLATLDISSVLRKKGELEAAKERLNTLKAKEAVVVETPVAPTPTVEESTVEETLITVAFKVVDVTPVQLAKLREFMNANNIKYTKAD